MNAKSGQKSGLKDGIGNCGKAAFLLGVKYQWIGYIVTLAGIAERDYLAAQKKTSREKLLKLPCQAISLYWLGNLEREFLATTSNMWSTPRIIYEVICIK